MDTVNEQTDYTLTLDFHDESGLAITPSAATYKIDDAWTDTAIKAVTAFTPVAHEYDLQIPYSLNKIVDIMNPVEERVVSVQYTYSGTKKGASEHRYLVRNLSKVVTPVP